MTGVAIVTGAARGIGAAAARRLAADGWRLVLVDRCADDDALAYPLATPADLDAVRAECDRHAGAVAVEADVRDQAALDNAVAIGVERFGGLDAAVAVAGCIAGGTPAWEVDEATWRLMIDVNLEGVWRLARAALPQILARPSGTSVGGRFVAVSSAGGMVGLPLLGAYTAAKHGVIGFVRSLAAELGPHGVTANVVAPGSTTTTMLDASAGIYELPDTDEFAGHHLLGRLLDPDEIAAVVTWLCGPDSSAITGAVVPADGGMTAR